VVFLLTLIRKEKLALQKQQLPWRRLYRGGKPPEDEAETCSVRRERKINIVAYRWT
jgi:hypothetical protein